MNKPMKSPKQAAWVSYVLLAGLLLLFVGGIYGISALYELGRTSDYRTVTLPAAQNPNTLAEIPGTTFKIESVFRQSFDFPIYNIQAVDRNKVVINRPDDPNSFSGIKLSLLAIDEKEVKDIASNVEFDFTLSPDKRELIYGKFGKNWSDMTMNIYQLDSGEQTTFNSKNLFVISFIDNNTFVGLDSNHLNLVISRNGTQQTLYGYDEMTELIAGASGAQQSSDVIFFSIYQVSLDKQGVFFLSQIKDGYGIYRFGLDTSEDVTEIATAEDIQQFFELGDGKFIIQGTVDGKTGIYIYDRSTSSFTLLAEGPIWNMALDDDLTRLGYFSAQDNQNNELHVAYLENGALLSDTVIYRNIDNLQLMRWHGNDLFLIGGDFEKGELYRFTLNAW
ncbi:hypothetical protein ACX93W_08395 [Paenibacillus sp. CAU 1782]